METTEPFATHINQAPEQESINGGQVGATDIAFSSLGGQIAHARSFKTQEKTLPEDQSIGTVDTLDTMERGLPDVYITELEYISYGYKILESSEIQGATYETINSRRKNLRKIMEATTMSQAVVTAIQSGFIKIEPDKEPLSEQLLPMAKRTLHLLALGWTPEQIAERYGISYYAVASYRGEIREKLGARSVTHAMRRAFEAGLFKFDEPIVDIDKTPENDKSALLIQLKDKLTSPQELGILLPVELELLENIGKLQKNTFTAIELFDLGFCKDVPSNHSKATLLGAAMSQLMSKLASYSDETVIDSIGDKYKVYFVLANLSIGSADSMNVIEPATQADIEKTPKPKRRRNKPASLKRPVKKLAAPLIPESRQSLNWPDNWLDPKSLPELDDVFFANAQARNSEDVLENDQLKKDALSIIRKKQMADHSSRLTVALRFGINPEVDGLSFYRGRTGALIKIEDILDKIPPFRGLDVNNVSLITGFAPHAILLSEKTFIEQFANEYPSLKNLLPDIESQLSNLQNYLVDQSK